MAALSILEADWPHLSRLLDEALELAPAARTAWLAALSPADARLGPLLRELLEHEPGLLSGDFLERPPHLPGPVEGSAELAAGDIVGPYRLVRPLGRGGMGMVWLAERADGLLQRQVALKLPLLVWGDGFARRLASEREILASLEHPNIARLYDTGLDDHGRPWIAMEHVEGAPIDAWCRERQAPVAERLALLLQVLAAVAHAHQRLVVHRDLKPANILVTREGQVKLLDFGIAKLVEDDHAEATALALTAGRALTIAYASPEQLRGEPLGTASDVYSLGVVAYELLAARHPFGTERPAGLALAQRMAHADPPRASSAAPTRALRAALRGDLDAVLQRALEKAVSRRYRSADAFAQDIQRYLAGRPVLARPASAGYRAGKFIGRHRVGTALTSALAAAVVGGVAVSIWQTGVARQQAARAAAELLRQEGARELFTQTLIRLAGVAAEDPASLRQPRAVDRALREKLEQMLARGNNTPDQVGAMLEAVTMELDYLDDMEGSLEVGRRYLAHLRSHGGDAHQVVFAEMMVAGALCNLRRLDECESAIRTGLAWSARSDDDEMRIRRAQLLSDLANALTLVGRRQEVAAVLDESRRVAAGTSAGDEVQALADIALSRFWLGFDDARAERAARRARDIYQRHGSDAENRKVADRWLGKALLAQGDAVAAERVLRESLALTLTNFGRQAASVNAIVCDIAQALAAQGRYREALGVLDAQRQALGAGADPRIASLLQAGQLAVHIAEGDAANAWLLASTAAGDDRAYTDLDEGMVLGKARALMLAGRAGQARMFMERVRSGWSGGDRATASWTRVLLALSQARLADGDAAGARAAASRALDLLRQQDAVGSRAWREAGEAFALACARLGDNAEAARTLDGLRDVEPRFASPVDRAESAMNRAEVALALGRGDEATVLAQSALPDLAGQLAGSPRLARARRLIAQASSHAMS